MQRFYFDHRDGDALWVDNEGLEFITADKARQKAKEALGEMAKDALPENGNRELAIEVRDETGAAVLSLSLSFNIRDASPISS